MDTEQAKQFLGIPGSSTATNTPATTAPLTTQAVQSLANVPETSPDFPLAQKLATIGKQQDEQFQAENAQPGTPLDVETGASPWERFMLSFRRDRANQVAHLQSKYGKENVRLASDGGLILRVADAETGKPKDLLVDEHNMSAKDFIDILGTAPEIAGGIYALKKGQAAPWMKAGIKSVAKDAVTMAVGAETTGLAKDLSMNVYDRGELDLAKTAEERAKMAAVDVGVGAVLFPASRFLRLMKSPLAGGRGKVQLEAIEAQNHFKEKYGVDVPLTIGESTGAQLIGRTEAFMEKLPGGGKPFAELKGQQEASLRKLQSLMMGTVPESDEAVGNRLIAELQKKMAPLEEGVESARSGLAEKATSQMETLLSGLTTPERQLYKTAVGKEIRAGVTARRDAVKAEADRLYESAKSLPGGTGKEFSGQGLQGDFKRILDKLPAPESTTEVPTGLVGPTGAPILRTETGKELLKEFVPPNILSRLKAVSELKDAKFSLSDLQQMRREVYDDIAKGEGVPGIGTHYLADIGKSLTKAIDDGVASLPSGDLKAALQAANTHYKEKVIPFNRLGVTELFRNADEAGHLADSQIVSRIFGGDRAIENYKLMKETLGDTSPEFIKLKRAIADNIIESSRIPGNDAIDAKSLIQKLSSFRIQNREIADDIFGADINQMFRDARKLQIAQSPGEVFASENAPMSTVPADELKALLSEKTPAAGKLRDLLKAESSRTEAYKVKVLKDVQAGKLSGDLNPEEFVNRFVDSSTSSDVAKVMDLIKGNPELTADIRSKMVEKLFRDAARKATPHDISQLMSGDPTRIMSSTSLFNEIENPAIQSKLKSILGGETFEDVSQYIKLINPTTAKEVAFQGAGGIAAGMQIANLVRKGPLKYVTAATHDWLVAKMLTSKPMRAWLTSIPAGEPGKIYMMLSSPIFLQQVTKEFGEGTAAEAFMNDLKSAVDKWTSEQSKQTTKEPQQDASRDRMRQFLNSGKSSLQGVPAQ